MMMSRRMWMAMMLYSNFVISRLFNLFPLIEVPVERFGVPGLGPELDNVGIRHLARLECSSEVDVHFPVTTVVWAIVELKLEGASIPNMIVALGNGKSILWPGFDNPVTLLFVAIPQHQAALLETITNEDNFFLEIRAIKLDIMGSSPVSTILSPPGKCPVEIRKTMFSPAFSTLAPVMLAVSTAKTVATSINALIANGTKQIPGEALVTINRCFSKIPVGITNSLFFMVPVSWVVFGLKVLKLPEVTVDLDTWLPELE